MNTNTKISVHANSFFSTLMLWFALTGVLTGCSTMTTKIRMELPPQIRIDGAESLGLNQIRIEGEWKRYSRDSPKHKNRKFLMEIYGQNELEWLAEAMERETREAFQDAVLSNGWFRLKNNDADLWVDVRMEFSGWDDWEMAEEITEEGDTVLVSMATRQAEALLRCDFVNTKGNVAATMELVEKGRKHYSVGDKFGLPNKKGLIEHLVEPLAQRAAAMLVPTSTTVKRKIHKKGSPALKTAGKKIKNNKWKDAAEIWKNQLQHSDPEVRQKAALNLAVFHEKNGEAHKGVDVLNQFSSGPLHKKVSSLKHALTIRLQNEKDLENWRASRNVR